MKKREASFADDDAMINRAAWKLLTLVAYGSSLTSNGEGYEKDEYPIYLILQKVFEVMNSWD